MKTQRLILAVACLVLALGAGFAIGRKDDSNRAKTLMVRAYDVVPERGDEIRNALNKIFEGKDGANDGVAQIAGRGLLLVKAPASIHHGIGQFIDDVSRQKPSGGEPIRIQYWVVTAEPASETNAGTFGPLSEVFGSINESQGMKRFRIVESLRFTSADRRKVKIKGSVSEVKAMPLFAADDRIDLEISVNSLLGEMETVTRVRPGDYLVLGQNALLGGRAGEFAKPASSGSGPVEAYHIIRAEKSN